MVPDSFTPVIVASIRTSTLPWLGSDKKYHVSYDLQLTNASRLPATLTRVDVVDARRPTTVISSLAGKQLVDSGCPYGDCNRLRLLPSMNAPNSTLAAGESRALLIDLVFDALDQVPQAVAHRMFVTGAAAPPARQPTPINYLVTPVDVSAGHARVISPPLQAATGSRSTAAAAPAGRIARRSTPSAAG